MASDSITIMLMVDDEARADILVTRTRTYYRFATDSSIEDGELAAVADFDATAAAIAQAMATGGSRPLPADVKMQYFVNNRQRQFTQTEETLRAVVDAMMPIAAEFAFLCGFVG